jgi:hypothetical protein
MEEWGYSTTIFDLDTRYLRWKIPWYSLARLQSWSGSWAKEENFCPVIGFLTRVEAGSNISTVTLRVVRGDEMGSLKSETVKYGREYQGTRTRERLRWEDPAAYIKDRPVLSSERTPHKNKTVTVK